ncbi:MAG: PilN domain-containing protein [Gaiellaceae bacterium]
MRAINLLPKDAERARRTTPDPALLTGIIGLAVVIVALGWMFMSASRTVQDKRGQRDDLASRLAEINRLNPPPKVLAIQQAMFPLQAPRVSAATSALSYRIPWDNILGEIARALPSGVKLTTLSATSPISPNTSFVQPVAGATATTTNLDLGGWTYAQESVALLMKRLQLLPSLVRSSVVLNSSNKNPAAGAAARPYYTFAISAQIRSPGAIS